MKASVIIPCHPRNRPTLARTRASVDAAAKGLDVEVIVVDDAESRGPSWARNEGLRRAAGDVVFFVDADDTVRINYFSTLMNVLVQTGADFVLSGFGAAPLKRDYNLVGNPAIRTVLLPAFFGFSFSDVRRWNEGGDLFARRELGTVWRCAFSRAFLERHAIRFDESLRLYEDAAFLAECAGFAERVASISDVLYDYAPNAGGVDSARLDPDVYYPYKFAALRNRQAIAARIGGDTMRYFEASAAFSALELLKARRGFRRYARDPFVLKSLMKFPISLSHPLTAAAILAARILAPAS